jgi:SAM-dependent methyltransferase
MTEADQFAIAWWKRRHENVYFPTMDQHYNWRLYDAMPGWFTEAVKPVSSDDALEIGCGYGQWVAPLSKMVRSVAGFDIHQTLVDKFNEQLADFRNVTMKLGDGLTIPFADKSFSLVYSIAVFQHMPRSIVLNYFKEAARVLKTDGRAFMHFRFADGIGPYSDDIVADHRGDWSVGWTEQQAIDAAESVGWVGKTIAGGDTLLLTARPR